MYGRRRKFRARVANAFKGLIAGGVLGFVLGLQMAVLISRALEGELFFIVNPDAFEYGLVALVITTFAGAVPGLAYSLRRH